MCLAGSYMLPIRKDMRLSVHHARRRRLFCLLSCWGQQKDLNAKRKFVTGKLPGGLCRISGSEEPLGKFRPHGIATSSAESESIAASKAVLVRWSEQVTMSCMPQFLDPTGHK